MSNIDFSIVVPAHNEAENLKILIPRLINALNSIGPVWEILIVDNASTDDTIRIVTDFCGQINSIKLVSEPKLGYGRAVLKGLQRSSGDVLGIIRADNQEKPEDLVKMLRLFNQNKWDFCKAVRKSRKDDGLKRILISLFFNTSFRILFGLNVRDINATPKIFTRDFMNKSKIESKDWFIDAEMVIKAVRLGAKIGQVEIEYMPRLKGRSSVRFKHILQFINNMLIWRLLK